MKKIFFSLALLSASLMGWAKQYCDEPLTLSDGAEIQLSCISTAEGYYQIVIKGTNLSGLGGSFYSPGAVDLRTKITSSTSTQIVCDIEAASAPTLYTPLYVLCPGEQNIAWPNDITWSACGAKTNPKLTINRSEITLNATNSDTCHIVPTTVNEYNGIITYSSDKESIASVDENGVVTAVGRGTAIITVTAPETNSFAETTKKLTVTVTGPINWNGESWLAGSNDKYKLFITPYFGDNYGGKHVENKNLWIGFPSAAFGAMSIEPNDGNGAWKTFALSNFPKKENQFTVECGGTNYTFDVYYADGSDIPAAIENVEVSEKARKVFENGQLIIIKNGVRYNALGVEVR